MSHTKQFSISPIAAAVSAALATPVAVLAQEDGATTTLDEIIVTASKREQNLQDIPASVQAIPEAMLREIGALNTEDYVRFMPSVNWINFNSGGNNAVIFRGVNTTTSGFIATQSSSVYLDEIPITSTAGDQPDLRMMDIARVEALAGPQGTLFGAAAQAGTLRVITNQPDTTQFEASADITIRTGDTSDPSHSVTAVFNIPLVEDVFAIRLAVQSAKDGGFIDNVLGHTPDSYRGADYTGTTRSEWGTLTNENVAEENWNRVDYIASRISALWIINDNWSATLAYHYGDTEANAGNDYNPFVGDLQTIAFHTNYSRDEWDMTSLTINADLGFAQFVSATSFFDRERTYSNDRTLYFKNYHLYYCEDRGPSPGGAYEWDNPNTGRAVYYPLYCPMAMVSASGDVTKSADFIGIGDGPEWQERFSQEFRLSHQGEKFDWLAGLYYEDSKDSWDAVWMQGATPWQESLSYANFEDTYGSFPDAEYLWLATDRTNWEQKAVFGEMTWHINDDLHLTLGGRWFETSNDKVYSKFYANRTGADGRQIPGFIQPGWVGNDERVEGTIDEFVPKVSLAWNLSDSKMMYGTYTVGYRTGGINRANRNADWSRTLFPQNWEPDKLHNYELGLKSRWANNTVQLNVAFFYMDWKDFQTEVVDPSSNTCVDPAESPPCGGAGSLPWLSIVGNSGDAHSTGVTAEFDWVPADGWTLGANATFLEAEIDKGPGFDSDIVAGLRLPNFPDSMGAAWASYNWPVQFIQGGEMFLRWQVSYMGDSVTRLVPSPLTASSPSFTNDSYAISDIRIGLISNDGGWEIDAFVSNVTDERAQLFQGGNREYQWSRTGEYDNYHRIYTNRPREFGVRFFARWGD